jgi:hypothetical protein
MNATRGIWSPFRWLASGVELAAAAYATYVGATWCRLAAFHHFELRHEPVEQRIRIFAVRLVSGLAISMSQAADHVISAGAATRTWHRSTTSNSGMNRSSNGSAALRLDSCLGWP